MEVALSLQLEGFTAGKEQKSLFPLNKARLLGKGQISLWYGGSLLRVLTTMAHPTRALRGVALTWPQAHSSHLLAMHHPLYAAGPASDPPSFTATLLWSPHEAEIYESVLHLCS